MSTGNDGRRSGVDRFRLKVLVAMMLLVTSVTSLGLFFAHRNVSETVKQEFQQEFRDELAALRKGQELRHAILAERCRDLAMRSRIHAALEDNALDLLYPSAKDELADVMNQADLSSPESAYALHALFYRFLDANGAVIPPPDSTDVGQLSADEQAKLALPSVPAKSQTGYLRRNRPGDQTIDEVIATPIFSTESGNAIAATVLGFKPTELVGKDKGIQSGIWLGGEVSLPGAETKDRESLAAQVTQAAKLGENQGSFEASLAGKPYLLFYMLLNPGSLFPPAYEVSAFPLAASIARQQTLVWKFCLAGLVLLLGALIASNLLAGRLSEPVEKLAVDSQENRAQRKIAEAALEAKGRELQRSARFSADASHQLKTPVTVLRTGLEELLAAENLTTEGREEIAGLVHQTFRLTNIIEDLLLLSRMDAGRLQLQFSPVDIAHLVAAWLDDLGALPDALALEVETDLPESLWVAGEKRYTTLILQNLLENARKYNRVGGRIRITSKTEGGRVALTIGNTGTAISPSAQEHIFDRFHRAAAGENVPGHGLGLNLARELARIHGGELILARSEDDWTEFEVRFREAAVVEPVQKEFA